MRFIKNECFPFTLTLLLCISLVCDIRSYA